MTEKPVLYVVIPCYNEEAVLPLTAPMFLSRLEEMIEKQKIDENSRILFVGFRSSVVCYERHERLKGESHYPLKNMIALALDGITSLSVKPLRLISASGGIVSFLSIIGILWAVITAFTGNTVSGWASMVCIVCFIGGIQLLSIGVIGEYVGKIYMEVKNRPRYIISERTEDK